MLSIHLERLISFSADTYKVSIKVNAIKGLPRAIKKNQVLLEWGRRRYDSVLKLPEFTYLRVSHDTRLKHKLYPPYFASLTPKLPSKKSRDYERQW